MKIFIALLISLLVGLVTYADTLATAQLDPHKVGPDTYAVKRLAAINFAANMHGNLPDAKVERVGKDDAPEGYRITEIDPNSVIKKMGMKVGDVILSVNDQSVVGKTPPAATIATLALADAFHVKFRRDGKIKTLTLQLEDE